MKTGVIIGRFQTPFLHTAHIALIEKAISKSDQVIILLGLSPIRGSSRNPLDYQTRVTMIREKFPNIIFGYVQDVRCDYAWSQSVDEQVSRLAKPGEITLYGSRDSFIPFYSGKHKVVELDSETIVSATMLREDAKRKVLNTTDFRAGIVYGTADRYPTTFTTVDVAIIDFDPKQGEKSGRILLGRKKGERRFRFIGGFASPESNSFEEDALREVREETGLNLDALQYVGSFKIDDWRYRNDSSKIKTIFYIGYYNSGRVQAADDIEEAQWFDLSKLTVDCVVDEHAPLFYALASIKS